MENIKIEYLLRCRKKGIVVSFNLELFDVVWKREFKPDISFIDFQIKLKMSKTDNKI